MNGNTKKRILVVDDEADVRNFLKAALIEADFEVITAEDGNIALEEVKKQLPDLISLDLVMPKKSGAKFYHELTKKKEWSKIPIIIVTGHARDDLGKADLKELTMSGPGVYLEKPVKPNNYIAAIKGILKMEVTEEEKQSAETVNLQNDLKNIIDSADSDTLKKLKEILNKKN
ncbi:MAG: response regulator [Ignavibacteriaceae bacterium]|jgi:DNA-binding response OmpR family regulator|nr:response regulator [Ignavibacteriaceae bacterium]MCW8817977.1 response regulator [Ignavibacteriaceae bacterium]